MHNFKRTAGIISFLLVIVCMNEVLLLALKPCNFFRNDIYHARTEQYNDIFVGTSHGKAGIHPGIVDEITGKKSMNLCLGGEYPIDSYFIIKELCRKYIPERVIYELDPGYWVTKPSLGPDYATVYEELPWSGVKLEYFNAKMRDIDFRATLFPWYVYRQGYRNILTTLRTKLTREYMNYGDSFYRNEKEAYGHRGAVSIHRTTVPKSEENLVLWDEQKLEEESIEYFEKLVQLCQDKGIELIVITAPIPEETREKYADSYEKADEYFREYMKKEGIVYYNFNEIEIEGFDRTVNGFSDFEGHMYEDQAEVFSRELGAVLCQ